MFNKICKKKAIASKFGILMCFFVENPILPSKLVYNLYIFLLFLFMVSKVTAKGKQKTVNGMRCADNLVTKIASLDVKSNSMDGYNSTPDS